MSSPEQFYDELADDYHLNYADWRRSVPRQGEVLDTLIQSSTVGAAVTVLDCTCGIGTQAIGLALRGYTVKGTDLSARSVERARREATAFGVEVAFDVADVRTMPEDPTGVAFDVVTSCDNSLPHLLTDADLALALARIHASVRPGGLIVIGIRDYDALRVERPRFTSPQVVDRDDQRTVLFQLWDWADDAETYTLTMFRHTMADGAWKTRTGATRYRALRRADLDRLVMAAGFVDLAWHVPDETGHHQPLLTARRATVGVDPVPTLLEFAAAKRCLDFARHDVLAGRHEVGPYEIVGIDD
jgi:glycine/sarcosine N-methyltransferase